MAFSIEPSTTVEEVVYRRIIAGIPSGQFYLNAKYVQPRRGGTTIVPFVINATRSEPDAQGRRVLIDIFVNEQRASRIAMTANTVLVNLKMSPPPVINYIRIVEGVYDPTTDLFTPTGQQTGTSVVVTNYGTVHYGAALEYFRKVDLPVQQQEWSLLSDWGNRLVQWYFKYHRRFPDTQAMQVLATRLSSRSAWNEVPTTRGATDMVAALCANEPVVTELSNQRPHYDLALYPLYPVASNWGGWEFDIWVPDYPTAKEVALLFLARTSDYLVLKDYEEGHMFLDVQGDQIHLRKDNDTSNLSWLIRQIGVMDSWSSFVQVNRDLAQYWYWWDNALDNLVTHPGLGAGDTFDTDLKSNPDHSDIFDSINLDSSAAEPFTELWTGLGVSTADNVGVRDSVLQIARSEGQTAPDGPLCWEWEYTAIEMSASANNTISNTLHGGAPPAFEE